MGVPHAGELGRVKLMAQIVCAISVVGARPYANAGRIRFARARGAR